MAIDWHKWVDGGVWTDDPFYRIQRVTCHLDGTMEPNRIILGNQGEARTNLVIFNFPSNEWGVLPWDAASTRDYNYILYVFNTNEPRSSTNPLQFESLRNERNSLYWCVNSNILEKAGTYELQFVIVNRVDPVQSPSDVQDKWVSNVLYGQVNNTMYSPNFVTELNRELSLSGNGFGLQKPPATFSTTKDNYNVMCSDIELGNRWDHDTRKILIKRDQLTALPEPHSSYVPPKSQVRKLFGVFNIDDYYEAYQLLWDASNSCYYTFIPQYFLIQEKSTNFCMVYTNGLTEDNAPNHYERLVTTSFQLFIRHGFLGSGDILSDNNFVTRYGEYVYTPDDTIINVTR